VTYYKHSVHTYKLVRKFQLCHLMPVYPKQPLTFTHMWYVMFRVRFHQQHWQYVPHCRNVNIFHLFVVTEKFTYFFRSIHFISYKIRCTLITAAIRRNAIAIITVIALCFWAVHRAVYLTTISLFIGVISVKLPY